MLHENAGVILDVAYGLIIIARICFTIGKSVASHPPATLMFESSSPSGGCQVVHKLTLLRLARKL